MLRKQALAVFFGLCINVAAFAADPAPDASRGELLYGKHCNACHTTVVHWRDKKLATDWSSLQAQVNRWQGNMGLGWSKADIAEVARHLNTLYYHYPVTD